ncbi:transposable element Tcb1 transposase [Trichonephila clavipes]|nr:transposable element Tcb1 transposase [Trichonephila clavipes]
MDDNATCHRTLAVQDCLDSEGIQRLVWPARSLDLNPIENVWDALGRQVAGRNYPPTNKNTLIRALTEEWDKLPQQLLDNVVQSMWYWDRTHDMPSMVGYLNRWAIAAPCELQENEPVAIHLKPASPTTRSRGFVKREKNGVVSSLVVRALDSISGGRVSMPPSTYGVRAR